MYKRQIFDLLTNPVEILTDDKDWVTGIRCIRMELGEPDASGRRRPVEIPGSEFEIEVDEVIMSLGTSPNLSLIHIWRGMNHSASARKRRAMSTFSLLLPVPRRTKVLMVF